MTDEQRDPSLRGVYDLIETVDSKHVDSHKRLREDLEKANATLARLAVAVESNYNFFVGQHAAATLRMNSVAALAERPVNGVNVVWSTRALATIFGAAMIIAGSYLAIKFDLQSFRSDLALQGTEIKAVQKALDDEKKQRQDDKAAAERKLSDFLNQRLENSLVVAGAVQQLKGTKK